MALWLAWASTAWADDPVTLQGYAQSRHVEAPAQAIALQTQGVVGLDLDIYPSALPKIRQVFPGTPAHQAHLLPGDRIVAINGQDTLGLSHHQVDVAISDVPGEKVKLRIWREGRLFTVVLTVVDASTLASQSSRAMYDLNW